jgi:hypothetical protein
MPSSDHYFGKAGQVYGSHTKSGKHYIYAHSNPSTGKIFYIGMGKYNRCNQVRQRNQYWRRYVAKHGIVVSILCENLSKDEAVFFEKLFIKMIKPKCNFTLGGECGSGVSKSVFAFDENKKLALEFSSISDANAYFNVLTNDSRISRCISGGRMRFKGYFWSDNRESVKVVSRRRLPEKEKYHQYDLSGNWVASFFSTMDANVPCRTGINYCLDRDATYNGSFWRSLKADRIEVTPPDRALKTARRVICLNTGAVYESVAQAAKSIGMCHQVLSKRLNGKIINKTGLQYHEQETNNSKNN